VVIICAAIPVESWWFK